MSYPDHKIYSSPSRPIKAQKEAKAPFLQLKDEHMESVILTVSPPPPPATPEAARNGTPVLKWLTVRGGRYGQNSKRKKTKNKTAVNAN